MVIATRHLLRTLILGSMAAAMLAQVPARGRAQAPGGKAKDGLFITVPQEITSTAANQIKLKVAEALKRRGQSAAAFTIVFDFNPNNLPSATSSFGSCMDLAEFIRNLRLGQVNPAYPTIKTIAFVRNEVCKHSVLPVLACGELIMANAVEAAKTRPRARLGDVLRDQENLSPQKLQIYETINTKYPRALVLRLIQPEVVVRKVKTRAGVRYWTDKEVQEHQAAGESFQVEDNVPAGLEVGNTMLDWERGREVGLCAKESFNTRAELALAYKLPRGSLSEDWLLGRVPVVWRIEMRGRLNGGQVETLERRLRAAIAAGANLIILQLECPEGETTDAASMARRLRTLTDQNSLPVKTIAYLPPGVSLGAATLLALGCNEIVMAPNAVLGDFSYLPDKSPAVLKPKRDMLVTLAKEQGYPPLLFAATLDPTLELYLVQARADPGEYRLVTEEEMKKDAQLPVPHWNPAGRIDKPAGQFLKLEARLAKEWGVALYADVKSPEALYAKYGLDPHKVRVAGDGWLEKAAEFFREPLVKVILIMLGIMGLILELKMPGIGLPGILSALCFVLFFWAHSFESQFTVLAVLLFVLGLILIGLEVFVLPGFGITGISGILLLVASLALVTLQKMPSTMQDWLNLGGTLATFGVSLGGAVTGAFILAWYLPHIPYANRLVLTPPGAESGGPGEGDSGSEPAALLGALGVAATTLRPAGKARFGDDFIDVIAEGDYVNPGSRVQVIEIEGNRIVVKQV